MERVYACPNVTRITVEPSAWDWEVFSWDADGEAWAFPARSAGAVRAIVREFQRERQEIPVTWLREGCNAA